MERFKAQSRGTKLVLVAGPLLFVSLFFTWQNLKVDYGRSGVAVMPEDGWDAWGLLIGLLVAATVAIVVLTRMTEVEMPENVSWDTVVFALGIAVFTVAVVKNVTDADSTWASYGFVALAGALAGGTYLIRTESRRDERHVLGRRRRRFSSAA